MLSRAPLEKTVLAQIYIAITTNLLEMPNRNQQELVEFCDLRWSLHF